MFVLALTVAQSAAQARNTIASINWSQPSWDLFIVLFFLVVVLLYGVILGRDRMMTILISIYMALAVVNALPYVANIQASLGLSQVMAFRLISFAVVFALLFSLLSRSALGSALGASGRGPWWQVFLLSVLQVGLLVSIVLSFLPPSAVQNLAPLTRRVFAQENARFIWIIAPILAMAVFRGSKKSRAPREEL